MARSLIEKEGMPEMKIFHLSDLHIGLRLFERDLKEDQVHVLRQVVQYAKQEQPDCILIAGDIYDRAVPSADAVKTFDDFVTELRDAAPHTEIMMISGNHDSGTRVNLFREVLRRQQIRMIGLPPMLPEEHIEKVTLSDAYGNVNFYLLPFVKPSMVKEIVGQDKDGNNLSYNESLHRLIAREEINTAERNVLVSHQFYLPSGKDPSQVDRMESETVTVGNIDVIYSDVLEPFDYAALGHIHKPMNVGRDSFRYCGTPMACSISESGQQKGIICIEMAEKGNVQTSVLPLQPLHEIRVIRGTLEEILRQACDDYVSLVLTDAAEESGTDARDRLHYAFPNLLEIRRSRNWTANYSAEIRANAEQSAFELCSAFLSELDEAEQKLLMDVINAVEGGQA